MPFTKPHGLITIDEACDLLPMGAETMRRLLATGRLKGAIIGRRWRTKAEWVEEFIEREAARREQEAR